MNQDRVAFVLNAKYCTILVICISNHTASLSYLLLTLGKTPGQFPINLFFKIILYPLSLKIDTRDEIQSAQMDTEDAFSQRGQQE